MEIFHPRKWLLGMDVENATIFLLEAGQKKEYFRIIQSNTG